MKGDTHCNRIIVSGSWLYCPFCGGPLDKTLAAAKARADAAKKRMKGQTQFVEFDGGVMDKVIDVCLYRASRGKPKGKQCTLPKHIDGRHRY